MAELQVTIDFDSIPELVEFVEGLAMAVGGQGIKSVTFDYPSGHREVMLSKLPIGGATVITDTDVPPGTAVIMPNGKRHLRPPRVLDDIRIDDEPPGHGYWEAGDH